MIVQIIRFRVVYSIMQKKLSLIQNKMFKNGGGLASNLIFRLILAPLATLFKKGIRRVVGLKKLQKPNRLSFSVKRFTTRKEHRLV